MSSTASTPTTTTTSATTTTSSSGVVNNSPLTDACCVPGSASTYPSNLSFPEGAEVKIGDIDCYSVGEQYPNVVIFSTDVFGWRYANNRQNANQISAGGFHVLIPDLFKGGATTPEELESKGYGWLFSEWFAQHPAKETAKVSVALAKELQKLAKKDKDGRHGTIQAVGYCYGTIGVLHLYQAKLAVSGVLAHPTGFTKENVGECSMPTLFLCAEHDQAFTPALRQYWEKALQEKMTPAKFVDYPGVGHGFAVRDDGSPLGVAARQAALQETVAFLQQGAAV